MDPDDKIVAKFVVVRDRPQKPGNYLGASCGMETIAAREALTHLKETVKPGTITAFCHDRDNKSKAVAEEIFPGIEERLDPNHCYKFFQTCWRRMHAKAEDKSDKEISSGNVFYGIKNKLEAYFKSLAHQHIAKETKYHYWTHAVEHLIGNHSPDYCQHSMESDHKVHWKAGAANEETQELLRGFLEESGKIFLRINPTSTTNICEGYNASSVDFTPKDVNYLTSWGGRTYLATFLHNEGPEGEQTLRKASGVRDVSDSVREELNKYYHHNELRRH